MKLNKKEFKKSVMGEINARTKDMLATLPEEEQTNETKEKLYLDLLNSVLT